MLITEVAKRYRVSPRRAAPRGISAAKRSANARLIMDPRYRGNLDVCQAVCHNDDSELEARLALIRRHIRRDPRPVARLRDERRLMGA